MANLWAKSDSKKIFSSRTPVSQPDVVRKEIWNKKDRLETTQTITAIQILAVQK